MLQLRLLLLIPACLACGPEPSKPESPLVSDGVEGLLVLHAPAQVEGTLSMLAMTREGRLLALVSRDLADSVIVDLGARRELGFRFEATDLAGAGASFVLEARYDPDGVLATNEPGSLRQRRVVAPGARQLLFELESEPLAAER